jgi:transposase
MQTLSIDRPSACDDIAILYVALELSKSSWLVALNAPGSNKISKHPVTGGDLAGLLALIERARTAAEARAGRPVRVVSCYEAGYDGFWLHRALTGAGIENRVLDPASIPVDRRRRRAKTDNTASSG